MPWESYLEQGRLPKNMISTWVKNKENYFTAPKSSSRKKEKRRDSDFEKLDRVVFRWFVSKRSQNIPLYGTLIK